MNFSLALGSLLLATSTAWAALPGAASVQQAYDQARVANAETHALDLVIEGTKCNAMKAGGFACQVDFVRRTEPERRLYFDVVTIEERQGQWILLTGLCMKKGGR